MKAWYVFHAKFRCESRAVEALAARGLTPYTPRLRAGPNGPGTLLFPAYLFVYGDLAAAGMAPPHYLPDLGETVAVDRKPAIVPQQVIAWLRAQGADSARGAPANDGQAVEDGFLTNLQTTLQETVSPQARADTLLRCLSQASAGETPGGTATTQRSHRRSTRGRGRRIQYKAASMSA
jgi:hypothetical protein